MDLQVLPIVTKCSLQRTSKKLHIPLKSIFTSRLIKLFNQHLDLWTKSLKLRTSSFIANLCGTFIPIHRY